MLRLAPLSSVIVFFVAPLKVIVWSVAWFFAVWHTSTLVFGTKENPKAKKSPQIAKNRQNMGKLQCLKVLKQEKRLNSIVLNLFIQYGKDEPFWYKDEHTWSDLNTARHFWTHLCHPKLYYKESINLASFFLCSWSNSLIFSFNDFLYLILGDIKSPSM